MTTAPDTLDLPGAAELLHCGLRAVKKLVDDGELPALQINQKHTVMLRTDVLDFIAARARKQAEERRRAKPAPAPRASRPRRARPDLGRYELTTSGSQGQNHAGSNSGAASTSSDDR